MTIVSESEHNMATWAVGDVCVKSGAWRWEVKVQQEGAIQIGWCTRDMRMMVSGAARASGVVTMCLPVGSGRPSTTTCPATG